MVDEKLQEEIRDFQVAQQQLQVIASQKFQTDLQLKEAQNAIEELRKAKADTDVYKVVGSILIKSDLEKLKTDLKEDAETLQVRTKSLDNQENKLKDKVMEMQKTLEVKLQSTQPTQSEK